ncbi:hypothetical protein BJ170DRAFT_598854 [Xylariales sp. AK1849]|nr:hypothetical protein BJ170DRAFT_598854 [Xylariales sp. AK1849]
MFTHDHQVVFLSLPVTCTGDLWHHAAAQILHSAHQQTAPYDLITVLGAVSEERDFHQSVTRAPAVFDYFTRIGVPCALARISFPDGGETEFSDRMLAVDEQHYLKIAQAQKEYPKPFDVLWPQLETFDSEPRQVTRNALGHREPRTSILHYFLSTTIAMQSLSMDISRERRNAHIHELREALGRISTGDDDIEQNVSRKVAELRSLIIRRRSSESPESANARVLLYNWRGPSTYSGHAGLPSHLEQISWHARLHGMLVIRVAAGVPACVIQETDLDLFDTKRSNAVRDKRFTARFWTFVQQMPEVFGLIGGRSGSIDIAAFVGMNCFEWDEPIFNIAAGIPEIGRHPLPSREYIEMQLPQYLRLLNQCSIVNVGLLDVTSYDTKTNIFTSLMAEELDRWLSGEFNVYPQFPNTEKARELLITNIRRIEEPTLGIYATNLRRICRGTLIDDRKSR